MPEPEHATPARAAAAGAVADLGPLLHDVVVRALHLWPEPSLARYVRGPAADDRRAGFAVDSTDYAVKLRA